MEATGEEQEVPGGVPNNNQLSSIPNNLITKKTRPVRIVKNTQTFTKPCGLIPPRTKHDSQIEVFDLSLTTDFFTEAGSR